MAKKAPVERMSAGRYRGPSRANANHPGDGNPYGGGMATRGSTKKASYRDPSDKISDPALAKAKRKSGKLSTPDDTSFRHSGNPYWARQGGLGRTNGGGGRKVNRTMGGTKVRTVSQKSVRGGNVKSNPGF